MKTREEDTSNDRSGTLRAKIGSLPRRFFDGWRARMVGLRNRWRRFRKLEVDFVVIQLSGPLPERSGPPRNFIQRRLPLPPRPLSLEMLNARLQRIADADNVRGAIFVLGDLSGMNFARLQNLRRAMTRLRDANKWLVVYSPHLDMTHYFVASAADKLYTPPGAQFNVVGLHNEAIFLRNALEKAGIQAEVLRVSPYKTAANPFTESEMTPEQRRQMTWVLEDTFDTLICALAEERRKTREGVVGLIDRAPFSAETALANDLVDALAYEDELPRLLASQVCLATKSREEVQEDQSPGPAKDVTLLTWSQARRRLTEKVRRPSRTYIGVLTVEGLIIMGASRQPPVKLPIPFVGGAMAGEQTLIRLLRRAERDEAMAALILHVDSGGGSALASELIWRQVVQLAKKKPVLAYMGDVAASGGYFISAGATHIMSQQTTLTGSIGVLMARMNLTALMEKLAITHESVSRGAHAGIYSEPRALTAIERELLWNLLQDTYSQFKEVVIAGRKLADEDIDPIAGGRVWTGLQAKEHGLVDEHGDFVDAVQRAGELSGLPVGDRHAIRTRNLFATSDAYVPPQSHSIVDELAALLSAKQVLSLSGRPLLLMPFEMRLH